MLSTSLNSQAARSSVFGSAYTRERGPRSRETISPTAKANRYGGIDCGIANENARVPGRAPGPFSPGAAAITAVSASGTVSFAW